MQIISKFTNIFSNNKIDHNELICTTRPFNECHRRGKKIESNKSLRFIQLSRIRQIRQLSSLKKAENTLDMKHQ